MRFDTAELRKSLVESQIKVMRAQTALKTAQEEVKIQRNKGASVVAQANLVHTLAELDHRKYEQGDYNVLVNDLQGLIALAKSDLEEAMTTFEHYKKLVKQGFRTPEQLRAKEEAVLRAKYFLSRDTAKLQVLEKFTRERQLTELKAKAAEAKRELGRAESSSAALGTKTQNDLKAAQVAFNLEERTQQNLELQLERFTVKAPQDGVVVYASGSTEDNRIRPGAVVHHKQKLFSLPDMSKMQVRAFVHESAIGKVKPGLAAEVRIDAYPQEVLPGVVTRVSTFYDPEREWLAGGVKEYATDIEIERLPGSGLKPGMTAEVRILVREVSDRLLAPMPAVAEINGKYWAYVRGANGFERRAIEVGDDNDRFVEIRNGLEEGDELALDVRARIAAEAQ
jgi:RND family efflux transporter MFP subunit